MASGDVFYTWPSVLVRNDWEVCASHRDHQCLAERKYCSSFEKNLESRSNTTPHFHFAFNRFVQNALDFSRWHHQTELQVISLI